ncbi:MAG: hypothetical protein MJ117_08635, partial [Lachnospiraceae bacterium]|nr:hypothetical protein [Lachnospiraceae bacterium]
MNKGKIMKISIVIILLLIGVLALTKAGTSWLKDRKTCTDPSKNCTESFGEHQIGYYLARVNEQQDELKNGVSISKKEDGSVGSITLTKACKGVLRKDVSVGDHVAVFDAAYRDEMVGSDDISHNASIFKGRYSITNYRGVEIICQLDAEQVIKSITIRET